MREKLQTLPLVQLRELAKAQEIKGVTTLKKAELIERLCEKTDDKRLIRQLIRRLSICRRELEKASLTGNVRQNLPGKNAGAGGAPGQDLPAEKLWKKRKQF